MTGKRIIGTYTFPIEVYLTDFKGEATVAMLANYLLCAATEHAEERGFGYACMQQLHRTWVLSRLAIEMSEFPKSGELLRVDTWIEEVNKLFTLRNFAFSIGEKEIGYARTVWASIDLETRKPCNILELEHITDYVSDRVCPIDKVSKIQAVKNEIAMEYVTIYSDIDINKHFNSVKYIEHIINLFSLEQLKEKRIKRFEITYTNEVLYGTHILFFAEQKEKDEHIVELKKKDENESVCRSRILFE